MKNHYKHQNRDFNSQNKRMGIVAFQWGENQLTLLQNREKCDSWKTKPAAWDEDSKILRGLPENNFGTWFGISRKGRVAFLVDPMVSNNLSPSDMRPVDFLRGEMSPWDFAKELSDEDSAFGEMINMGLVYDIIVADINSNSMFYISKRNAKETHVHKEEVDFGVHTLSSAGLDSHFSKELRMKDLFKEMIGDDKNKEVPPLKEMAEKFTYDPLEADKTGASSSFDIFGEEERYRRMSTTALVVKPTKEVTFYERYLENGEWKDHDFIFNIA